MKQELEMLIPPARIALQDIMQEYITYKTGRSWTSKGTIAGGVSALNILLKELTVIMGETPASIDVTDTLIIQVLRSRYDENADNLTYYTNYGRARTFVKWVL